VRRGSGWAYGDALDVGADRPVVTGWIAQTQAERVAAERQLCEVTGETGTAGWMSRDEIAALLADPAGRAVLRHLRDIPFARRHRPGHRCRAPRPHLPRNCTYLYKPNEEDKVKALDHLIVDE
jgi:hypothetical protein